jgi:hypothetical protein
LAALGLPVVAIAAAAIVWSTAILTASSAGVLGGDFLAYQEGVRRFAAGGSVFVQGFDFAGQPGLFYYPPTFALLMIPFALLSPEAGVWTCTVLVICATLTSIALMPIPRRARWFVLLLAGVSWPVAFALKLGQVGPFLLLAAVIGWRWLDNPVRLGVSMAFGAAIKVQPLVLFGWAAFIGRTRAVMAGFVGLAVLGGISVLVFGPSSWTEWTTVLDHLRTPLDTPHNLAPGRLAVEAGMSLSLAWWVQALNIAAAAVTLLVAARWASAEASYLVAVVVAQLASPLLWDHYALMLLLPVGWLLGRGRWLAAAIPLVTSVLLIGITPPIGYFIVFWVTAIAVIAEGRVDRTVALEPRVVSAAT